MLDILHDLAPAHHPTPERLAAYASGWAAGPVDLCVRAHLETCARCRATVSELEAREAAFIDALPEAAEAPPGLRALVEGLAHMPVEATPRPAEPSLLGDVALPRALAGVGIGLRRWVMPGLWVAPLDCGRDAGWRTYLLRAPPGQRLPAHGHVGAEMVCVLSGAFEDGARYGAGDFVETDRTDEHEPRVTPDGACACLIATQGGMVARGLAGMIATALAI